MKIRVILLLVFWLSLSMSFSSCWGIQAVLPATSSNSSLLPLGLRNKEQWIKNLKLRLRIGYREDASDASFGGISRNVLTHPSLYATHAVIGIASELGQPIENPEAVQSWIVSLMDEDGAYNDKSTKFSKLTMTLWAVETLRYLGFKPKEPEKTIAFIRSLQEPDGFFRDDEASDSSTINVRLEATSRALAIFRDLGVDLAHTAYLDSTREYLEQTLGSQLALQEAPSHGTSEVSTL